MSFSFGSVPTPAYVLAGFQPRETNITLHGRLVTPHGFTPGLCLHVGMCLFGTEKSAGYVDTETTDGHLLERFSPL